MSLGNVRLHRLVIVQDTEALIPIAVATGKDVTWQRGETLSGPIN